MPALGLPLSAWANTASYAQSSYPEIPRKGDRIFRTDFANYGMWMNYIVFDDTPMWVPDSGQLIFSAAQSTTNQTIAETGTNVQWDLEIHDYFGMHSGTSADIVAPFPGRYLCSGKMSFSANSTGARNSFFTIDGSEVIGSEGRSTAVTGLITEVTLPSIELHVTTGDIIRMRAAHSAGTSLTTNATAQSRQNPRITIIYAGA